MIISKTPYRISFFGGGTDFPDFFRRHKGAVISTTINKFSYVNVSHLPDFFEFKSELIYSKIERVNDYDEIQHPLIREAMRMLNIHRLQMIYETDIPEKSGLGTSSSFAVGMLNALYALMGEHVDKKKLAKEAIELERNICHEVGGFQDQIAVTYGGLNRIDFNSAGYTVSPIVIQPDRQKQLNDNLLLIFSGETRISSDIQKEMSLQMKSNEKQLIEMLALVDEAEILMRSNVELREFGRLLDYTWHLKRGFSKKVSTESIDLLYQKAKEAGAIGGKLLGAGGGGFLIFYVEKENKENVYNALEKFLHIPFSFESKGTRIIYSGK